MGLYLSQVHAGKISSKASEQWKALADDERAEYVEGTLPIRCGTRREGGLRGGLHGVAAGAPDRGSTARRQGRRDGRARLEPHLPYLPLSRVRRLTRLAGAKSVSKTVWARSSRARSSSWVC